MSNPSPGDLFYAATQSQPLPVVEETTSSCCGPKPAAAKADAKTAASSCCGPKPAAAKTDAKKAGSSCCGPAAKSTTDEPAKAEAARKKSSCCG